MFNEKFHQPREVDKSKVKTFIYPCIEIKFVFTKKLERGRVTKKVSCQVFERAWKDVEIERMRNPSKDNSKLHLFRKSTKIILNVLF
jgi:hypothetical protein